MIRWIGFVAALGVLTALSSAAADPMAVDVWPGLAPGEKTASLGRILDDTSGNVTRVTDITRPQMLFYPAPGKGNHPAILLCPGGAYEFLAENLEGTEVAEWLNGIGFTVFVLKYRVPNNRDGAFQDGQRSLSLLRDRAKEYHIDPKRLGVMGFSAGGHLSARLAAGYESRSYTPIDSADRQSCRPDFAVLVYPAYLIDKATGAPALEVKPHAGMPPVFLTQTQDDPYLCAPAYAAALHAEGVDDHSVIYGAGGHGYGLRLHDDVSAHLWPNEAAEWLEDQAHVSRRHKD